MSNSHKENPAVAAAGEIIKSINSLILVSDNPNPRQRWRGNPPMKRQRVSAELLRHLETLATGRRS